MREQYTSIQRAVQVFGWRPALCGGLGSFEKGQKRRLVFVK